MNTPGAGKLFFRSFLEIFRTLKTADYADALGGSTTDLKLVIGSRLPRATRRGFTFYLAGSAQLGSRRSRMEIFVET
jgi:hypothetical protein